jgi:hypothetical protein
LEKDSPEKHIQKPEYQVVQARVIQKTINSEEG